MYVDVFGFSIHSTYLVIFGIIFFYYSLNEVSRKTKDYIDDELSQLRTDLEDQIDDLDRHIGRLRQANNPIETPEFIHEEKIREVKENAKEIVAESLRKREAEEEKKKKSKTQRAIGLIIVLAVVLYSVW